MKNKINLIVVFVVVSLIISFSLRSVLISNEMPLPDYLELKKHDNTYLRIPVKYVEKLRSVYGNSELPDWSQMSPEKDGYEGTSTLELYEMIISMNPVPEPKPLIVAVMDSGFEIDHPDLKDNVWNNDAEINGSPGIDDDDNGYVDDFYGWNFLGKATDLNLEVTREYARLKKEGVSSSEEYYKKVSTEYETKKKEDSEIYGYIKDLISEYEEAMVVLKTKNVTTDPKKLQEISETLPEKEKDAAQKILGVYLMTGLDYAELKEAEKDYEVKAKILYDLTFDPSSVIGDNGSILNEKNYGDNDVTVKRSSHGTHVAGIIGASKKGIGQAPFVKMMFIRVVPAEGDERDKDIANGIKYAVDNGAAIINLSAGKYFARNADYVKEAIRYAEEKGVLFVAAAGNEGTNIETRVNYPPKFYRENGEIKYFSNLLCVGANSWMKTWNSDKDPLNQNRKYDLCAPFSNYSDKVVDLFAPGVEVNSTVPGKTYKRLGGTSMAAPNAAGVAAILKGYFPELNASDLKNILMESSRKYGNLEVKQKEFKDKVLFSKLSRSGGVVDAKKAFELAKSRSN